ncbi:hypothetical protein BT63DRAFT_479906 [Microthyrium microscopicum]|uniref:Phosphatidate phosphatase APP1 catalytic domain-containing protein n=1 Tax=Microthyrium microscopicum TaxID=703497 RepID=A0A6A6UBL8_9PEZI|nr:hypothetical protein BT63DRAFT_479906 [Microthyrium microscopicum]
MSTPSETFNSVAGRIGAWRTDSNAGGPSRESGARRAKLRGMLSGLKDVYDQKTAGLGSSFRGVDDFEGGMAEAYPDANITRSGHEEMVLFPSYSRRHVATAPANETDSGAEDETDGAGEAPVHQHWDQYEDRDAVVDVDVRGWIYTPHKGPMNRKQRLALGIARQLAGLPAPASPSKSPSNSRDSSPHPIRQRMEEHNARKEQRLIDEETENMVHHAKEEAHKAERGEYSEGRSSLPKPPQIDRLQSGSSINSLTMAQKRASWNIPSEMSQDEVSVANSNLMSRLSPFYANPQGNTPVSAFFYNETDSRQRTIYTNAYGQFALRASLDFVPTHVRVLAGEDLSANQDVKIMEASGISVISDIDDTLKHTNMIGGAREAFRNAFLRNLEDLVVDGVHEWFTRLHDLGVHFHYVSNSPWQLFPALSRFFASVNLPPGSFHLKQYSGMLQGIFEPVAERKKSTLDRIARDFPERKFLLIGDSGEADLEVYLDFVRENPGRVLGIFIRDVTTPASSKGYFDSNLRSSVSGANTPASTASRNQSSVTNSDEHDPELKAAIDASLREFEAEEARRTGTSNTSRSRPLTSRRKSDDLISFSDSDTETKTAPIPPPSRRKPIADRQSSTSSASAKLPPPKPHKKPTLRSSSVQSAESDTAKSGPPIPPKRASTIPTPTPDLSNSLNNTPKPTPPTLPTRNTTTYTDAARSTLASAYNALPAAPWSAAPPPAPPRRPNGSQPTPNTAAAAAGMTRAETNRLELWKRRWANAEHTLRKEGILLRTWKVGSDALPDSERIVKRELEAQERKRDKEGGRFGRAGKLIDN